MSRADKFEDILNEYKGRKYKEEFNEINVKMDFHHIWDCFSHDGYKDTIRLGFLTGKIKENTIFVEDVIIPKGQEYNHAAKKVILDRAGAEFLHGQLLSKELVGAALYCGKRQFLDYNPFLHDEDFKEFPLRMLLNAKHDYEITKDTTKLKK